PAFIGAHSTIEAGAAILPHTVVGASAVIRRGARLERALLLDHVYAGIDTSLTGCVVGRSVEIGSGSRLADGAVVADECRLEQEVDVSTGSLVYPGKTLESGSRIHGAVVWDSTGHRYLVQAGGLSGTMSVDITPENVVRAASALASVLPKDAVVSVARDQSRAARSYSSLLTGALTASGITVRDHRVAPAPVLRDDVGRHAAAGVLVRATAGRPERLDIVLLDSAGRDISDAESRRISRVFERREFRRPFPGAVGDVVPPEHALEEYAARVRSGISLEGVAQADLTVVVDSAGGSSALALPTVLRGVDVDLVLLGGRLEESRAVVSDDDRRAGLRTLADTVVSMGASLGLSIDSTGERLSIVDDLGQVMDDDRALLVVMDLVASEAHAGHVVLPVTASRLSEQVAGFHGVEVRRVPSTQTFVADEHALLSSDGQGGFAVRGSGGRRDAIATALALIGLVARTNLTLSAIESRIPRSVTLRHAVQTPWAAKGAVMRAVQAQAGTRTADHTDGVRVLEDDGSWCLVLPDAHEPLTRLWVEAPSYARGMQVGQEWIALVENVVAEHRRDRE
ncbi:MAG: mannose-1-phosphate guanyltransferase, partial [Candidatus Nanopelagicales bacterium]